MSSQLLTSQTTTYSMFSTSVAPALILQSTSVQPHIFRPTSQPHIFRPTSQFEAHLKPHFAPQPSCQSIPRRVPPTDRSPATLAPMLPSRIKRAITRRIPPIIRPAQRLGITPLLLLGTWPAASKTREAHLLVEVKVALVVVARIDAALSEFFQVSIPLSKH